MIWHKNIPDSVIIYYMAVKLKIYEMVKTQIKREEQENKVTLKI